MTTHRGCPCYYCPAHSDNDVVFAIIWDIPRPMIQIPSAQLRQMEDNYSLCDVLVSER